MVGATLENIATRIVFKADVDTRLSSGARAMENTFGLLRNRTVVAVPSVALRSVQGIGHLQLAPTKYVKRDADVCDAVEYTVKVFVQFSECFAAASAQKKFSQIHVLVPACIVEVRP